MRLEPVNEPHRDRGGFRHRQHDGQGLVDGVFDDDDLRRSPLNRLDNALRREEPGRNDS